MIKILLKKSYTDEFNKEYILKMFLNLLNKESKKTEYTNIFTYISNEYNISRSILLKAISNNIVYSTVGENVFLTLDNNHYIKSGLKLDTVVDLITFGSRDIKGCNLFTKIINYLNTNMSDIFFYYCMVGRKG